MSNDLLYGVVVLALGAAIIYGVFSYASIPVQRGDLAADAVGTTESGGAILYYDREPAGGSAGAADAGGASACSDGEEKACATSNSCDGKQFCVGGKWSGCVRYDQVCEPGNTESCTYTFENGACGYGQRTCNSCGNGWSTCS